MCGPHTQCVWPLFGVSASQVGGFVHRRNVTAVAKVEAAAEAEAAAQVAAQAVAYFGCYMR